MIEQTLLIVGAAIFGILGTAHLLFTFFTNKFNAFDKSVTKAMKNTSPVLTKETTMWNAWVGFNASHSVGAMLVTAFYVPLVLTNMAFIRESMWFSIQAAICCHRPYIRLSVEHVITNGSPLGLPHVKYKILQESESNRIPRIVRSCTNLADCRDSVETEIYLKDDY